MIDAMHARIIIERVRNTGTTENISGFRFTHSSDVAHWLKGEGYTVINFENMSNVGYANTSCGMQIFTNGDVKTVK